MEPIDIEARTIDEAIEKACREFQTTREKLKIDIIAEGNPGFLGFGSRKALIRAGILQIDRELDNLINGAAHPAPAPLPAAHPAPGPVSAPSAEKMDSDKRHEVRAAARKHNAPKVPPPPAPAGTAKDENHPDPPLPSRGGKTVKGPDAASFGQPEAKMALELVEGILTRMNIPARVKLSETEDMVMLTIVGDGDGLLIGKRGQNLDAIQYIVNKAVHRTGNDSRRIVIDTEKYRKRREDTLLTTALQTAQKVKTTRKPVTLGPMNPHDRRIIHIALKNDKTLATKSRGEGEYRKITILPARRGAADETA
jgi:spoIIIJ-associated protein